MRLELPIEATQTGPSIARIGEFSGSRLLREAKIKVPATTNPIAFAFSILDGEGDPIILLTGVYPGMNYLRIDRMVHGGYHVWIRPEAPPGNYITIRCELELLQP